MFCPGEDGKTRYSMHYAVSYKTVRGRSPRHINAYLVLAELLILDGEQVNQLCAQVYSGLQIYGFNWSLNVSVIVSSFPLIIPIT